MPQRSNREATDAMIAKWHTLSAAIAMGDAPAPDGAPGHLLILGSGMSHVDLMINDEAEIRSADYIFHCLYDRVTQIWLNELRPDAYDLRILYAAEVDRHDTYVCMAEAMLHHVRRGKKVVAVFYGHPGIFATPTHRAVKVARREGYRATMRPGISALDYMVADVGFDPMIPGLLSFEASDLLMRRRRIDPTLHVVLWQVGVVGELQFSPRGFANRDFALLVAELERCYGPEWPVTHYIAPQYVGVDPLIEHYPVASLETPEVRAKISALSTFYIAPRSSLALANRVDERAPMADLPEAAYDLAAYGAVEMAALRRFTDFTPPNHYAIASPSPAAAFMLELSRDIVLQERYRTDPQGLLASERFATLTDRARQLLAIPHPLAINAAIAEPERSA